MASIFSEVAEEKAKVSAERERTREDRALKLRDTRSRVRKYDRLKKRNAVKVKGRSNLKVYNVHTPQSVKDKKLKRYLKSSDSAAEHAARKAARCELLLQEEPG